MGAMSKVQKTMKVVIDREKEAESEQKMILELQIMIKNARKEITM